jgi:serine/threonine protein kinase
VHRSPAGVLQLKVADFGIGGIAASQAVKEAAGKPERYVTAMAAGTCTPLYASPQQAEGRPPDPRDDVFALGIIWFQALSGNLSAPRPGGFAWRTRLAERGMAQEAITLLESCFDDDPDERPRDAAELAERLAALLALMGDSSISVSKPPREPVWNLQRVGAGEAITKADFHGRLRKWLDETDDPFVGDSAIGVTPWIHVRDGDARFYLNSDTRREAVTEYLRLVDQDGDGLAWAVVANRRGRMNAVAYGPEGIRIKGFYLYLSAAPKPKGDRADE